MATVTRWRRSLVEAWADGDQAVVVFCCLFVIYCVVLAGFLGYMLVVGLLSGLPWTLAVVPFGWGFYLFFAGIARDARKGSW